MTKHAKGFAPVVHFPGKNEALLLAGSGKSRKDVTRRMWFFNQRRDSGQRVEVMEVLPIVMVECSFPEPCREALAIGVPYFYPDALCRIIALREEWSGDSEDMRLLERGLVHLTLEAAQAHAEALLSLSK